MTRCACRRLRQLLSTVLLMTALSISVHAARAADGYTTILPGTLGEKEYLIDDRSVLREIGYDPLRPFVRVADGERMSFSYRFAPGRSSVAYLLISVGSRFVISISDDSGSEYKQVSDVNTCERTGWRVFVDLTPFLHDTDAVRVKFESRYKNEGWGAILSDVLYFHEAASDIARISLNDGWKAAGRVYSPGTELSSPQPVTLTKTFRCPVGWPTNKDLALYLSDVTGAIDSLSCNNYPLKLRRTPDMGYWASIPCDILKAGAANLLSVNVRPVHGVASLWAPVRVGLRLPACAVPAEKRSGKSVCLPTHQSAPYTPDKMNYLASNFMQSLYDSRYDLLTFVPDERMPIHFVHDTLRSLAALEEEDRYTGVARLELARKLYAGCKRALLPGGEMLFAFKHDKRPVDIRPLGDTPALTLNHKLDNARAVAAISAIFSGREAPVTFSDTATATATFGNTTSFTRTWTSGDRRIKARAAYAPGDADTPPCFDFDLDGKGPVRIEIGKLAEKDMWFVPGSWGPEAVLLQGGKTLMARDTPLQLTHPAEKYLLIRGGNSGNYTFCRAMMVMWDTAPDKVSSTSIAGGRYYKLYSSISLEYQNDRPGKVRLTIFPYDGFPESLNVPQILAENILRTGKFGMGVFDPVATSTSNGLGPEAMSAAAWMFRKHGAPEAAEAEAFALQCMKACTTLDLAGTHTEQLYYLINACRNLAELGHPEYLPWVKIWADRILEMQQPDGTFAWLNYQFRCMAALLKAYEITGDHRYRDAFDKALKTLEYRDNKLYWKGSAQQEEDFAGALPFALYGHLGLREMAQTALDTRAGFIDDRGFQACSDLNPYMLGFSATGLTKPLNPPLVLGLKEFVRTDAGKVSVVRRSTAYVVNPYHPMSSEVDFKLPR